MTMRLTVRAPITLNNREIALEVSKTSTVWAVKVLICRQLPLVPFRQVLKCRGETLREQNEQKLKDISSLQGNGMLQVADTNEGGRDLKKRKVKHLRHKQFQKSVKAVSCFASGPGLERGVVGLQCDVHIFAVTGRTYEQCFSKDLSVFAVEISKDGHPLPIVCNFSADDNDFIHAKWVPEEEGRYSVSIKLYGDQISCSPTHCEVIRVEKNVTECKRLLNDPVWQIQGAQVLADWATKEEMHKVIMNGITLPAILNMVSVNDSEISSLLAETLKHLLEADSTKSKLLEEGGLPSLLDLANLAVSERCAPLLRFVTRSLAALSNILANEPENLQSTSLGRTFISRCNQGMFEKIAEILEINDTETTRNIARTIAELSELKKYRSLIASTHLLNKMITFSSDQKADNSTRRYALQALANFAGDPMFRDGVFDDARVIRLLELFRHPFTEDSTIINALRALANLCNNERHSRTIINSIYLDSILDAIGGTDTLTAWEIQSAMPFLSDKGDSEFRQRILRSYGRDGQFNYEGMRLLANLLSTGKDTTKLRERLRDRSGIRNLVQFLKSVDTGLQREAGRAIAALCFYEDCRQQVVSGGGATALCAVLNTGDVETAEHVVAALGQMPIEAKSVLGNIVGDSGIDQLIRSLKSKKKENQRSAAILLASLVGNEETKRKVINRGGREFMAELVNMVRSGEVNVQNEIDSNEIEMGKLIGEGVSGKVYAATWRGEPVAVKAFDEMSLAFNEEEFKSEVALMSVLRHEHIAHCLGSSSKPGNLFIVSELFNQGSVATVIKNEKIDMPVQRCVRMALEAARGIRYLHSVGLIHRDLKNGNLLVTDDFKVKVADFGLSRVESKTLMTRGVGTPIYTAPETLSSSQYSFKADTYSFAYIMWEMFSRTVPFLDLPPFLAVQKASEENLRPPMPPNCILETLINRCWAPDAAQRPDFDEIVENLEGVYSVVGGGSEDAEVDDEDAAYEYQRANELMTLMTMRPPKKSAPAPPGSAVLAPPSNPGNVTDPSRRPGKPELTKRQSGAGSQRGAIPNFSKVPSGGMQMPGHNKGQGGRSGSSDFSGGGWSRTTPPQGQPQQQPPPQQQQQMPPQSNQPSYPGGPPPGMFPPPGFNQQQPPPLQQQMQPPVQTQGTVSPLNSAGAPGATGTTEMVACARCGGPVMMGMALKAMDKLWHNQCFTCTQCHTLLTAGFCRHNGMPYCAEDFRKLFAPRCARCNQVLSGQFFQAIGKAWHPECFSCTRCHRKMQKFFDVGGYPYCNDCAGLMNAAT